MKLPKSIKVGYKTYDVGTFPSTVTGATNTLGITDHASGRIHIAEDTHEDEKVCTLIHEILHTLFYESGVEVDPEIEERVCSILDRGLVRVMRDNPKIFEDIMKYHKGWK